MRRERTLLALALLATATVTGCARTGRATSPTSVTMTSETWDLWVDRSAAGDESDARSPERCPSPCVVTSSGGELEVLASEHGEDAPSHRERVPVDGPLELHVARWSHDGERVAGGVMLGVGIFGFALTAGALAAVFGGGSCECGALGPTLASPILLIAIASAPLLGLRDHPTYDVRAAPVVVPRDGGAVIGVAGTF